MVADQRQAMSGLEPDVTERDPAAERAATEREQHHK
jgi:hypothetical protein